MVMRLRVGSWVVPTASESMLKPRRANRPAQRVSTPARFSTSTERVWYVMWVPHCWLRGVSARHHLCLAPLCGARHARVATDLSLSHPFLDPGVVVVGPLQVDHVRAGGAGRHHRVDLLLVVDASVDHAGAAALERTDDGGVDLLRRLAAEAGQAEALGQLDVVGQV